MFFSRRVKAIKVGETYALNVYGTTGHKSVKCYYIIDESDGRYTVLCHWLRNDMNMTITGQGVSRMSPKTMTAEEILDELGGRGYRTKCLPFDDVREYVESKRRVERYRHQMEWEQSMRRARLNLSK